MEPLSTPPSTSSSSTNNSQPQVKYVMKIIKDIDKDKWGNKYPHTLVKWTSIGHLIVATISFTVQIALIGVNQREVFNKHQNISASCTGLWCGIYFLMVGVFGTITVYKPSKGWNIATLLMSIAAGVFATIMIAKSISSIYTITARFHAKDFIKLDPDGNFIIEGDILANSFLCGVLLEAAIAEIVLVILSFGATAKAAQSDWGWTRYQLADSSSYIVELRSVRDNKNDNLLLPSAPNGVVTIVHGATTNLPANESFYNGQPPPYSASMEVQRY